MSDVNSLNSGQPFFSADLDPTDLDEILRRIDENLALRPILHGSSAEVASEETVAPSLPGWPDLAWRLHEIRQRQSPFFVVNGRDLANQFRRLLNLPLRVFGRKQAYFNREVLGVLGETVVQLQALRSQAEYYVALGQRLDRLHEQIQQLEAQITRQPKPTAIAGLSPASESESTS